MVEGHLLYLFQAPDSYKDGFCKAILSHQLELIHIHYTLSVQVSSVPSHV